MAVDISNGGLNFGSSLDPTGFLRGANIIEQSNARLIAALDGVAKRSNEVNANMARSAREAANSYSALDKVLIGTFTAASIGSFVNKLISVRGEFQQINSAFVTMLGSKEKADKLMAEAVRLAATTPFALQDVASGAKQLLAYGFAAEDITKQLTNLGNIASGVGAPLNDLVYLYGTLKASGRVTQMDINQFAGRGIPIYEELAKVMGVTTDKVRSLVTTGKVGFPQIEQAFNNMTGTGGKFFNLMQEQSKSLTGQISNLGDAFDQMFNDLGKSSEGILSGGIQAAIILVQNYEKVLEVLGVLITTYGAYKAAVIVATFAQAAQVAGFTVLEAVEYRLLLAQEALNASMLANPYVLVATALAALVGAMIIFGDNTSAAEQAQKRLNDENERFAKLADEKKQKYDALTTALRDNNTTEFESNRLFKELQSLYPELFNNLTKEEYLRKSVAAAQKEVNSANDNIRIGNLGKQADDAEKQVQRIANSLKNFEAERANLGNQGGGLPSRSDIAENLEAARAVAAKLTEEYKKQRQELTYSNMSDAEKLAFLKRQKTELETQKKQIADLNKISGQTANAFSNWSVVGLNNQLDEVQKKINLITATVVGTGTAAPKNISTIDADIKKLKEDQESSTNNKQFNEYQAKIKKLEIERRKITGETDKVSEKAAIKTVKIQENFAEKRADVLKKITETEKAAFAASLGQNAREIAENKAKYDALLADILEYNVKAKKAGAKQIGAPEIEKVKNLAKTEETAILYRQETAQQAIEFEKQKKAFADYEEFKTSFGEAAAKKRYGNETKTNAMLLSALKQQSLSFQSKAATTGLNVSELARFEQLGKQIEQIDQMEQKRFANALQAAQTYTQRALQIDSEFQQQKQDLFDATNGKATQQQYKILEEQKNAKLRALNEENAYAQSGYADLMENMLGMTKAAVLQRLAIIKQGYENNKTLTPAQKQTLIAGVDTQISKLDGSQNDPFAKAIKSVKEYKKAVKDSADETVDTSEKSKAMFGAIGGAIDGAGQIFGEVTGALANLGIGTDKYTQATLASVQGLLGGMGELAKGIASGNPVDIIKGSISILTSALELFNTKDKKLEKQIDGYKANLLSLQKAYTDLDRSVRNAVGESIYTDQASQIENLKRQQQELIRARDAESQKKKKDQGKIDEYNSQINAIPDKIEDITKAISENLIQGTFKDLSNSLADALTDAFKSGEDGMAAMDKSFNAFIGNAIKNSLKLKLIEPIIAGLTKDLVEYAKENGNSIVGFDFSTYKADLQNAGKTFNAALDANKEFFTDASDKAGNTQGGLAKGISGITETTANRLEAEFGGLRLAQLQLLSVSQTNHSQLLMINTQKLNSLLAIEANTRGTKENTDQLTPIRAALESIDKKTSDTSALLRGAGLKP